MRIRVRVRVRVRFGIGGAVLYKEGRRGAVAPPLARYSCAQLNTSGVWVRGVNTSTEESG